MRARDTPLLHLRQVTYKFTPSLPPKCHSAFLSGAGGMGRTERGPCWSKFLPPAAAAREREGARPVNRVPEVRRTPAPGSPGQAGCGAETPLLSGCPASR